VKIDSHQHFWSLQRPNDYGFLTPAAGVLYRDWLPADLEPVLKSAGVERTILVQAAETLEETQWLLDLAGQTDFVAGVVGWVNMDTDTASFRRDLDAFRRHPKFVGLRPMLQDLDDDRFILRPHVLENLKVTAALDFPFDILIYPKHLPHIYEMLQRVPGLRAVIDHLAKPVIRSGQIDSWQFWMEKISRIPGVWCKLSGMVTEADHQQWKKEDFVPYVHAIMNSFGAERVMFGSDWPVCLQAATYQQVLSLLEEVLDELPGRLDTMELERIFGENAAAFYKVQRDQGR